MPSKDQTIIFDGGGQNFLAGSCPPIRMTVTFGSPTDGKGTKGTKGTKGKKGTKGAKGAKRGRRKPANP